MEVRENVLGIYVEGNSSSYIAAYRPAWLLAARIDVSMGPRLFSHG
jgi:hypothetical protein